jgi:hypothetical protein
MARTENTKAGRVRVGAGAGEFIGIIRTVNSLTTKFQSSSATPTRSNLLLFTASLLLSLILAVGEEANRRDWFHELWLL